MTESITDREVKQYQRIGQTRDMAPLAWDVRSAIESAYPAAFGSSLALLRAVVVDAMDRRIENREDITPEMAQAIRQATEIR